MVERLGGVGNQRRARRNEGTEKSSVRGSFRWLTGGLSDHSGLDASV